VELCAAVGAPDAYAGELPVAFATLKAGARVSEEALLAFTAERVDEAPAKPKSITILERMPVTNVGKIYKPELRTLATGAVVQALVDQVYGVKAMRPRVTAQGDLPVSVSLERDGDADLHRELQALIAALPVKVQVISAN
jgi:fatty-acyl-CoA synthase